jgi:hypothetical protein
MKRMLLTILTVAIGLILAGELLFGIIVVPLFIDPLWGVIYGLTALLLWAFLLWLWADVKRGNQ